MSGPFKMKGFPMHAGVSPMKRNGDKETRGRDLNENKGQGYIPQSEINKERPKKQRSGPPGTREEIAAKRAKGFRWVNGSWKGTGAIKLSDKPEKRKKKKKDLYSHQGTKLPKSYTKKDQKFLRDQREDVVSESDKK